MGIGIVHRQPFGGRGGVEFSVRRNQRHATKARRSMKSIDFAHRGELDGIVSPQSVCPRQEHGIDHERRGQLHEVVSEGEMAAKMPQDGPCLGWRETAATLSAGDGGINLDGGDPGQEDRMSGLWASQGTDPGGPRLAHMAFDEAAGIEEVDRHLNDARG